MLEEGNWEAKPTSSRLPRPDWNIWSGLWEADLSGTYFSSTTQKYDRADVTFLTPPHKRPVVAPKVQSFRKKMKRPQTVSAVLAGRGRSPVWRDCVTGVTHNTG